MLIAVYLDFSTEYIRRNSSQVCAESLLWHNPIGTEISPHHSLQCFRLIIVIVYGAGANRCTGSERNVHNKRTSKSIKVANHSVCVCVCCVHIANDFDIWDAKCHPTTFWHFAKNSCCEILVNLNLILFFSYSSIDVYVVWCRQPTTNESIHTIDTKSVFIAFDHNNVYRCRTFPTDSGTSEAEPEGQRRGANENNNRLTCSVSDHSFNLLLDANLLGVAHILGSQWVISHHSHQPQSLFKQVLLISRQRTQYARYVQCTSLATPKAKALGYWKVKITLFNAWLNSLLSLLVTRNSTKSNLKMSVVITIDEGKFSFPKYLRNLNETKSSKSENRIDSFDVWDRELNFTAPWKTRLVNAPMPSTDQSNWKKIIYNNMRCSVATVWTTRHETQSSFLFELPLNIKIIQTEIHTSSTRHPHRSACAIEVDKNNVNVV